MIILTATITSQPGRESDLEKELKDMVNKVKDEEGTLLYTLHRSKKNAGKFFIYEKYKDKAAFDFHSSTDYFKGLFAAIKPMLGSEPVIEFFDELASR